MSNVNEVMQEIHTGVMGLQDRIAALESAGRQRKALNGAGVSCESQNEFSFRKAIQIAVATSQGTLGQDRDLTNCKEFKIMTEATKKAMDTGTGGAGGGYVIPQAYLGQSFIEMQRANSVVLQAGATLMEGLNGSPAIVPKQLTGTAVYWIGQNATITASDPTFGQVQMTPKTMAIRAQYSNLLNVLANPAMEGILRRDLAKVAALELDRVALRGSGAANQPLGVNGVTGLGTYAIGTNGGDLTRQDLLKITGVLDDQNALYGKLGFIMNPKAKRVLKNERIAQYSGQTLGEYQVYPLSDKFLANALDYPVYTTTQIPATLTKGTSSDCSEVYFGNWEELLIGVWGGVEILATNIGGNAWTQNAVEIRLIQNVDVQVRHGESFVLCNDARTNNA